MLTQLKQSYFCFNKPPFTFANESYPFPSFPRNGRIIKLFVE